MVRRFAVAAAAVALLAGGGAFAQSNFPTKPVHIYVPYPPGGGVDILTRTLGDVVSKQWGQTVLVENRPGAGGVVASQALVQSPPDGYTLIMVASGHATNPFLYPKIPYDTFRRFHADLAARVVAEHPAGARGFPSRHMADVIAQAQGQARQPLLLPMRAPEHRPISRANC